MLRRAVYDGRITHGDTSYPGTHQAIIDRDTFEQVQAQLASSVKGQRCAPRANNASLLAGRVVDAAGDPLITTHATNGTARYRYYVSRSLHLKTSDTGMRIPARELETLVVTRIATLFADPLELSATLWLDVPAQRHPELHARCASYTAHVTSAQCTDLAAFIQEVRVHDTGIEVVCDAHAIATALTLPRHADAPATVLLTSDVRLTRSGRMMRLVHSDGSGIGGVPDASLIRLLVQARRWWAELRLGEIDIKRLAEREGRSASWITRVVRLAFLAPTVVEAILAGRLQAGVDGTKLTLGAPLPVGWREQDVLLVANRPT